MQELLQPGPVIRTTGWKLLKRSGTNARQHYSVPVTKKQVHAGNETLTKALYHLRKTALQDNGPH